MATRTKLLSGRNINTDSDFSKYIETVSEPGVIEGLQVSTNSVGIGKCWVPCERTNGETIYSLVESFTETSIDTSGTGYVIVEIGQTYIDDGSLINEDGTGVATIKVVSSLPLKNYLELAELDSGVITDSRNMIKKVGELNTAIESLTSFVNDINERVEALETAGAIDHLEEEALVGELYTMSNTLFLQKTPKLSDSTLEECFVGDVDGNKEIHIQRMANGDSFNTLKLNVKKVGSPTTNLKVEVREGVQVTVTSNSDAYWYGDSTKILATGSIPYSSITTSLSEIEFTLNQTLSLDKGKLINIVVYQESGGEEIVNNSNYYILGCDTTQWGEAYGFVSVNGTTRVRSKVMPYCISGGFADKVFAKIKSGDFEWYRDMFQFTNSMGVSYYGNGPTAIGPYNLEAGTYRVACSVNGTKSSRYQNIQLSYNDGTNTTNILTWSMSPLNSTGWKYGGNTVLSEAKVINQYGGMTGNSNGTGDYYGGVYTEITPIKVQKYGKVTFNVSYKKDSPKEVKGLGKKTTCYLFGRIADGSFWYGRDENYIEKADSIVTKQLNWSNDYSGASARTETYTIPYDGIAYFNVNRRDSGSSGGNQNNWIKLNGGNIVSAKGTVYCRPVRAGDVIEVHTGGSYCSANFQYWSY